MAITFDTLKFAKKLKAAGVKREVAEAHAEAEAEVFAEIITNQIVTKQDITKLESKIERINHKTRRYNCCCWRIVRSANYYTYIARRLIS